MTENLPKGIVLTKENVSSELAVLGGIDIEDIIKLWRVYSTNSPILQNRVGPRLENFFWRIWSSKRIYSRISGSTLATLFVHICDGSSIQTTPTATPKKPRRLEAAQHPACEDSSTQLPRPATSHPGNDDHSIKEEQTRSGRSQTRLPPILKKSHLGHGEQHKTTRILISDQTGESILQTASSNPPTPLTSTPSRKEPLSKQGRKRTAFVANTALNSRRRPVLPRRKSSQPSSGAGSTRVSPRISPLPTPQSTSSASREYFPKVTAEAEGPTLAHMEAEPAEVDDTSNGEELWPSLPLLMSGGIPIRTDSPVTEEPPPTSFKASSVYRHRSPKRRTPEPGQSSSVDAVSQSLVDNNFRTRFAEKIHQGSFGASLAASYLVSPGTKEETKWDRHSRPSSGHSNTSTGSTGPTGIDSEQTHAEIETGGNSISQSDKSYPILRPRESSSSFSYSQSTSPSQPRSQLSLMIAQSRRPSQSESNVSDSVPKQASDVDSIANRPTSAT